MADTVPPAIITSNPPSKMPSSLRIAFNICLFKAKPQDLPASSGLVLACAILSFLGYQTGNALLSAFTGVTLISLTQTVLLGASLWLLLALCKKPQRWLQSAAALYGASAVTHFAALPVMLWISDGGRPPGTFSGAMFSIAVFRIWFFAVLVYILKETLEIPVGRALAIALGLQLVFALVLINLFGNSPG